MARTLLRIGLTGVACALIVLGGGSLFRRALLGADDAEARARIEAEVRGAFASMTAELGVIAGRAASPSDLRAAADGDTAAADRLFASTETAVDARDALDVAVTVFAADGRPLAWAGRPTELPRERLQGKETWFLEDPGELGLRLVHVTVVEERGLRLGVTAAERPLAMLTRQGSGSRELPCADRDTFCFPTQLGPVAIERPFESARTSGSADTFEVRAPSGERLLTATIKPEDLALTRDRWWLATQSIALIVLAATVLLMTGPLLDWRNRARGVAPYLSATILTVLAILAGRAVFSAASPADWTNARLFSGATYASSLLPNPTTRLLTSPFDFLLSGLAVAALVAVMLVAVESWRLRSVHRRRSIISASRLAGYLLTQTAAGSLVAAALIVHEALLRDTIAQTTLDLVHFSLQPWDASRTALQVGLVVAHATVAGTGVLLFRAASVRWRVPRRDWRMRLVAIGCWSIPLVVWQALRGDTFEQQLPLVAALAVVIAAATLATRLKARYRHGSQAFRLTLLTLGLILPAFAFYPTLFQLAGRATAQTVQTRYADEVLTQRRTLLQQMEQSKDEIDAIPDLAELTARRLPSGPCAFFGAPTRAANSGVSGATDTPSAVLSDSRCTEASTDRAFRVWRQTALNRYPITSSIELYDRDGNLVSRFAFNLPEDLTETPRSEEDACDWEVFGEVAPFFAEERPVVHMGRALCAGGTRLGSIVVNAMIDYENLPFISSRTPYRELLRPADGLRGEDRSRSDSGLSSDARNGRDVEFAFYGWSGRPLYPSSEPAWKLEDDVLRRLAASRQPFWAVLRRGDDSYNVYLQNDRGGIYALGFPVVTPLGHLVNLAELTVLATGTYLLLLLANAAFGFLSGRVVRAPALLREIRASFYRKLFLAFVAAVIFPVGALAVVTRNYVVDEMRSSVEREAVRTASAAGRVVEDLITQLDVNLDDNLMVWVSRLIDQDANVFDGSQLIATSERNLFASGLLPTRTPASVYRAVQLENVAATVAYERVGTLEEYLVAATPLNVASRPGAILTVPLTSRQQDIETQIATLNRNMLLGALLFILAGAGLGYSMAERISDPVNRLTRATRRISRGDLDARIVARSSDELRRLVEDFNSMAAELQRQRKELERTHRVEAWAEMARQVAHEIKNPLTPIQLTAEHLRRVHADRGEPLSPVLQECVATILSQVTLLRQIASEFSSFASSPTARPAVVLVPELLQEILEPYRVGLQDRIRFEVDVPDTLPPVYVDRTLMSRSLTNIVENALHAMPARGTLTVVSRAAPGVVRIRVSDTGAGMDAEALARAFEPYFSTKATGTGLGLPIAKRNIELNRGTIAVSSERDRGTTVEIALPVSA